MSSRSRPPSRKPPSQRRHRRETRESRAFRADMAAPALDYATLDRICSPRGLVRIGGASVPIVRPHRDPADPTEFDRQACSAGLARFIRPRVASDGLDPLLPASIAHMLVVQLAPGIRTRTPIELVREEMLN